jgi:hypothetical protein
VELESGLALHDWYYSQLAIAAAAAAAVSIRLTRLGLYRSKAFDLEDDDEW